MKKKPPKSAVFPQDALFHFERLPARQSFFPLGLRSCHIFRVREAPCEACAWKAGHPKARIIQQNLICAQ